ncbi:MAG: heavy metal translocating P-type ATPase metal-binding domain-containing protein [Bacteroidota bacterium]|nr:heavy metal translocating P-type ATPase metal-binding domain-containing protein [Bacteroidota bacterium]
MANKRPDKIVKAIEETVSIGLTCYHCNEQCDESIQEDGKVFCCNGCKQVYLLLKENDLCTYYHMDDDHSIKAKGKFISGRFAYLDDETILNQLAQFRSEDQVNITFSIPQMHCSSCIYLLEHLNRIDEAILKSQTNFQKKQVFVIFDPRRTSLRKVVELLAFIGYEPYISLKDASSKPKSRFNRRQIYRIGVAGFCFSNIMMLSFPEYFSGGHLELEGLRATFGYINLGLSLPVLFFSASDFFISAWKALRQKYLNIDAPIALALIVTFTRSYYEILSGHGTGYLDSGTGIVLFMLIGRWFQDRTYESFAFDKDYLSYFPLGVTILEDGIEQNVPVTRLKKGNRIIIRNEEMIPADSILLNGRALVDYSFVSGENTPVSKARGELIYAGGKQMGSAIELEIIREASQSYISQLWNNEIFSRKKNEEKSFIHPWSRYFTMAVFAIAAGDALYWWLNGPSHLLATLTAVLIVACPCSLLLSATFTYGNMHRILGRNKVYLKNSSVIESLARVTTVVFDKTGTLTHNNAAKVTFDGSPLSRIDMAIIKSAAKQSSHPLSKIIAASLHDVPEKSMEVHAFREWSGKGIEASINNVQVRMGAAGFVRGNSEGFSEDTGTGVHVVFDKTYMGKFRVSNQYRKGMHHMMDALRARQYSLHVLSGDNDSERENLLKIFGDAAKINFHQSPQQKLDYIKSLQEQGQKVLMIGDGLNDAGALMQSDVGIAVSENSAHFTPACDAIMDGSQVSHLHRFMAYSRTGKRIVGFTFFLSILYNIIGLSFAVQGLLSPIIAAILMPASSISIVLLVSFLSTLTARISNL